MNLIKYPRTLHIEGSNLQAGDEGSGQVSFSELREKYLVVEEKMDGSNTAISFNRDGKLLLQSRGHFLGETRDKKHFDPFKRFAYSIEHKLKSVLGSRYILYGEWLFAKHTIFYNRLDAYFQEFDIYDREKEIFLATPVRHQMLEQIRPFIKSVRVLKSGYFSTLDSLLSLVGKSAFISDDASIRLKELKEACQIARSREDIEISQTDLSGVMEGLYIKVENNGIVEGRFKWVRHQFIQTALDSGSHWDTRPLVKNRLQNDAI